ncbi:hypothetical protein AAVH_04233 [Aphelenchoides avenae]|nr:hypothetical protein AAVH_04233 [Aphelenchus avenae]
MKASLRSAKTVCVPFTLIEWQHVKDRFLSNDPQTLREASALLNMWKCRMGRATPVLIDITELLLRALIMDLEHKREDGFSVANVGLIYGAVIIR